MVTLRPGDVLQHRYRVDRLLGEGGMSWVYQGHHLLLEHPVAIKVIKPLYVDPREARQHAEQLRVEASIMARLDHPNLVRAFDMFQHGEESVLVLEMVEGRNLDEVAQLAPKPISERRVLAWTAQILDALEYLHSQDPPVIVRDLKPGNIMLGKDGRIRLIDFGLAKRMDSQGSGTRAIVRGMGSEGYAPLEQYAQASTDARSDLYAVGASMYFLLTKRVPPAASLRVADESPLADPREINPTVSVPVWTAMQRLLAVRPAGRPANAAAARQELGLSSVRSTGSQTSAPAQRAPGKRCACCDLLLDPRIREGIEVDVCRDCGGVWLDRGELEQLMRLGREALTRSDRGPSGRGFHYQGSAATPQPGSDGLSGAGPSVLRKESQDERVRSSRDGRRSHSERSHKGRHSREPGRTTLHKLWDVLEDLFK
jgi:serine/threonine protein kinase